MKIVRHKTHKILARNRKLACFFCRDFWDFRVLLVNHFLFEKNANDDCTVKVDFFIWLI